jgi:hypothetical protein
MGILIPTSSDRLRRDNINPLPATGYPFTMACWAKVRENTLENCLMWLGDKDVANHFFALNAAGDQTGDPVELKVLSGGAENSTRVGTYTINRWHLFAGIFQNATSRTAYLDGVNTLGTTSRAPTGCDRISIGIADIAAGAISPAAATIAWAAIWNIGLSLGELDVLRMGCPPWLIRPGNLVFLMDELFYPPAVDLGGALPNVGPHGNAYVVKIGNPYSVSDIPAQIAPSLRPWRPVWRRLNSVGGGATTPVALDAGLDLTVLMTKASIWSRPQAATLTLTPTQTRIRTALRALPVTLTLTSTMTRIRTGFRLLAASLTLTAVMTRVATFPRLLTVNLPLTVTMTKAKKVEIPLAFNLPLNSTMTRKAIYQRILTVTLTLTPTQARLVTRFRAFAVNLNLTAAMTQGKLYPRALNANLPLTATVSVKQVAGIALNAVLTLVPAQVKVKTAPRLLAASLTLSAAQTRLATFRRTLAVTLTLAPVLNRAKVAPRTVPVTLTLAPAQTRQKVFARALAATLTLNAVISFLLKKTFAVTLNLIPSIIWIPTVEGIRKVWRILRAAVGKQPGISDSLPDAPGLSMDQTPGLRTTTEDAPEIIDANPDAPTLRRVD